MKKIVLILFLIINSFSLGATITESKLNSILKDFKNPKIDAIQKYSNEIFSQKSTILLKDKIVYKNLNDGIITNCIPQEMERPYLVIDEYNEKSFKEMILKNSMLLLGTTFFIYDTKDVDLAFENTKFVCLLFFTTDTKNTIKVSINTENYFSFSVNEKVRIDIIKDKGEENKGSVQHIIFIPAQFI